VVNRSWWTSSVVVNRGGLPLWKSHRRPPSPCSSSVRHHTTLSVLRPSYGIAHSAVQKPLNDGALAKISESRACGTFMPNCQSSWRYHNRLLPLSFRCTRCEDCSLDPHPADQRVLRCWTELCELHCHGYVLSHDSPPSPTPPAMRPPTWHVIRSPQAAVAEVSSTPLLDTASDQRRQRVCQLLAGCVAGDTWAVQAGAISSVSELLSGGSSAA
jgi:hypothetical protein